MDARYAAIVLDGAHVEVIDALPKLCRRGTEVERANALDGRAPMPFILDTGGHARRPSG